LSYPVLHAGVGLSRHAVSTGTVNDLGSNGFFEKPFSSASEAFALCTKSIAEQ
jgi:hypothetical protein